METDNTLKLRKDQKINSDGNIVRLPYRCEIHGMWYDWGGSCGDCRNDQREKIRIKRLSDLGQKEGER